MLSLSMIAACWIGLIDGSSNATQALKNPWKDERHTMAFLSSSSSIGGSQ